MSASNPPIEPKSAATAGVPVADAGAAPVSERSRRQVLGMAVLGGAGATAAFFAAPGTAAAATPKGRPGSGTTPYRLTVMGTTDTHGNVLNWDYFKDAVYDDGPHNDI